MARQFLIWILSYTKLHLLQRVKVLQSMLNKLMVFKSQFLLIYLLDMVSYVEYVKILLELNRTGTGSSRAINSLFELTFKGRRLQIKSGEVSSVSDKFINQPNYVFIKTKTKLHFQELTPIFFFL